MSRSETTTPSSSPAGHDVLREKHGASEKLSSSSSEPSWLDSLILKGVEWAVENDCGRVPGASSESDAATIVSKLVEMMSIVASKTDEVVSVADENGGGWPWYCYLSIIQLNEIIKARFPDYRDKKYMQDGETDVTKDDLLELRDGVDFAKLAYEENYFALKKNLSEKSYVLLRHDVSSAPGRVGHYIAINHKEKVALIGLKGTSSFSDIVTDLTGKTVEHTLDAPFSNDYSELTIRCHEGIWTSALTMADDITDLARNLFLPAQYRIIICGHSLGAGSACLLGLLLRSRIPELRNCNDMLRVMAIASPPVLSYSAALACREFSTALVCNADIVPRMSLSNFVILSKLMVKIDAKLEEKGLKPHDFPSAIKFVQDMLSIDGEPLFTCEEIDEFFEETHQEGAEESSSTNSLVDNLYVPGRVVVMWGLKKREDVKQDESNEGDEVEENETESIASSVRDQSTTDSIEKEEAKTEESKFDDINVVRATGSMRMLRQLEVESCFLDDHRTVMYQDAVRSLLRKYDGGKSTTNTESR